VIHSRTVSEIKIKARENKKDRNCNAVFETYCGAPASGELN